MMNKYHAILTLVLALLSSNLPAATDEQEPLYGRKVIDVQGTIHTLGAGRPAKASVIVFLGTDCPIARRSIGALNRAAEVAKRNSMVFLGVISDPTVSRKDANEFRSSFEVRFPLALDSIGALAERLKPTHVPEAFLIGVDDQVLYRGAIDDAFAAPGKPRAKASKRFLEDAISSLVAGNDPTTSLVPPVGCEFEAWTSDDQGMALPDPITYTRHIAPILDANCVTCHREGQVAPFKLTDYATARRKARTMARVCEERFMPPWNAEPGFGQHIDQRFLSERQIKALEAWAKGGAPEGDRAERTPVPKFHKPEEWSLGKPDVVLQLPEPFQVPATGADIYRHFVLPINITEDKALVGIDFKPGATEVVHHVIVYHDDTGKARALDAKDKALGYDAHSKVARGKLTDFWGIEVLDSISGWAPGQSPYQFPKGVAQKLPAGGDIVIEVHYHPNGQAQSDQSQVALYFTDAPIETYAIGIAAGTDKIDIPPGEPNYKRHVWLDIPTPMTIYDVAPHMHLIGREFKVEATLPDGSTLPMNWIRNWDFRWQDIYSFSKPLKLPAGSRINVWATYDNSTDNDFNPSDPPVRVKNGWETTDEMMLVSFTVLLDKPEEEEKIWKEFLNCYTRDGTGDSGDGKGIIKRIFGGGD